LLLSGQPGLSLAAFFYGQPLDRSKGSRYRLGRRGVAWPKVDLFWDAIVAGNAAFSASTSFDVSAFDAQIAAEVTHFDPNRAFPSPRRCGAPTGLANSPSPLLYEALLDSGLDLNKENRDEIGVFLGSGIGGLKTVEDQHEIYLTKRQAASRPS